MKSFMTFVINLASQTERKAFMAQQLAAAGVPFEIVTAVDGKALTLEQTAKVYDEAGARAIQRRPLSRGEIGCALSHVSIYHEVVSRGLPAALVLEDDARLNADFGHLIKPLAESIAQAQQPTVYLLTHLMRYKKPVHGRVDRQHGLHQVVDACCAHGYLINQSAAKELVEFFTPIRYPIDAWTRIVETGQIQIFGLNPYIVGHSEFSKESNLETDRGAIDHVFQPAGLKRFGYYLRFYLYEKFFYQIYKLLAGIKKQHKQNWDLR